MFARTLRHWSGALLTAGALALVPQTACTPKAEKIGDVTGDKVVDDADVDALSIILTANSTDPSPPDGPGIADVALPCGGPLDEADLRALRAALAVRDALAAGHPDTGVVIGSACHGAPIGDTVPQAPSAPAPLPSANLDELFDMVAAVVPEFGGVYVEDGKLKVVLTDTAAFDPALAALDDVFGEHRPAEFLPEPVEGRFGFGELMGWRALSEEMLYLPVVTSVGVDERQNAIKVGVANLADRDQVLNLAAVLGVPAEALVVEEVPLAEPFALKDELQQTERPLRGGLQIQSSGTCSLGLVVKRGGVLGFLTNAHCTSNLTQVDGDLFFQSMVAANTWVGTETVEGRFFGIGCPGFLCTEADVAFVQISPNVTGRRGMIRGSGGVNPIVQLEAPISFQGMQLAKTGRTTGFSQGEVTDTCETVKLNNNNIYICQNKVDAQSDGGDSGSPVYRFTGSVSGVELHGLLWGGPVGGGGHFWYVPLGMIESSRGVGAVDTLNINEPPQVTITNPINGTSLGAGNSFNLTLSASFWDFEDGGTCSGCTVTWIGPTDGGILGTSTPTNGQATLAVSLFGPGGRWIIAEATDAFGNKTTDQVYVGTDNAPPTVTMLNPANPVIVQTGDLFTLTGTSFDPELFGPLPCSSLEWISAGTTAAPGCLSPAVFPNPGVFLVTLKGTDADGAYDEVTRQVTVVLGPSSGPPTVWPMTPPTPAPGLVGYDQLFTLVAYGNDPDDKHPLTYQWILKAADGLVLNSVPASQILGSSGGVTSVSLGVAQGLDETDSNPLYFVPSDYLAGNFCGSDVFSLEIEAQDADGQPASVAPNDPSYPLAYTYVPDKPC